METLPLELLAQVPGHCDVARPTAFATTADWLASELAGYERDDSVRPSPRSSAGKRAEEVVLPHGTPGVAGFLELLRLSATSKKLRATLAGDGTWWGCTR
jgi:hypothetical protein